MTRGGNMESLFGEAKKERSDISSSPLTRYRHMDPRSWAAERTLRVKLVTASWVRYRDDHLPAHLADT